MKRTRRLASGLLVGALFLISVPQAGVAQDAAGLTGVWEVSIDSPEASIQMIWTLEQHEDGTVTGYVHVGHDRGGRDRRRMGR